MTVLYDNFTDVNNTLLTAHTGEIGATWTKHGTGAGFIRINTNRIYNAGAQFDEAMYYGSGVPQTADYDVEGTVYVASTADSLISVMGRLSTSANTFYQAFHYKESSGPTNIWALGKRVAGVSTTLGTYTQVLSAAQSYRVRLEMRGTTLRVYVDDVERISTIDSSITAVGRAGVRVYSDVVPSSSTGLHMDSINVHEAPFLRPNTRMW